MTVDEQLEDHTPYILKKYRDMSRHEKELVDWEHSVYIYYKQILEEKDPEKARELIKQTPATAEDIEEEKRYIYKSLLKIQEKRLEFSKKILELHLRIPFGSSSCSQKTKKYDS